MKKIVLFLLVIMLLVGSAPGVVMATDVQPLAFTTEPMIVTGWDHTLALRYDGTVWAWGDNSHAQLGDGTQTNRSTPVQVQGLSNVVYVAAGAYTSIAVRSDGTAWQWGSIGNGSFQIQRTPVIVQSRAGTFGDITAIAVGQTHRLALRNADTAWAWGRNAFGQLGRIGTTPIGPMAQVQSTDGLLSNVSAIAAGNFHSMALCSDGSRVWVWGQNAFGQLAINRDDPNSDSRFFAVPVIHLEGTPTAISAGNSHSVVLMDDGTVQTFGGNTFGQLGNGTIVHRYRPAAVQNLSNITAISAAWRHNLALHSNGTVWAWGRNAGGELGDGTTIDRLTPVQVQNLRNITAIAGGTQHNSTLRDDGTVWTWGVNAYGQLGNGTTTNSITPVQVVGPNGVGHLNLLTSSVEPPDPEPIPFTDVTPTDWFYSYVSQAYSQGIMQGTTPTTFAPRQNLSRAQVVATLYRITHGGTAQEIPYANNRPIFDDVNIGSWHSPYIAWAYDNNIVLGVGNNRFAPGNHVTREQLATMLFRFADFMDYDVTVRQSTQWDSFTDRDQIRAFANNALIWANYHGLITGRTPTTIAPRGNTTRGEAAAVLMRFMAAFDN